MTVRARGKALIPTDLSVAIPPNCYGRVGMYHSSMYYFLAPRSGLALKKFIDVGAGVVDCDYRGPLGIVLFNFGDEDFEGIGELYVLFVVKKGDRVAQLVLERICMAPIVEVDSLDETSRGSGGFGSTGIKKVRTD